MIGRPIRRPIRRKTSRGFSLLEVLVAFTILTMLLGALFQVFSNGLRAARAGDSYTRATVIAQSRLAALGVEQPLQEGTSSGSVDDTYHWRVIVRPYADDQMPAGSGVPQPFGVDVEIFWEEGGGARSLSLTSMRLATGSP
jgi:general secretion pathway protein I